MKRWLLAGGLVLLIALLGACGGDEKSKDGQPAGGATSAQNAAQSRTPVPRSRVLPAGKAYDFEAPFSAGQFVRQAFQGRTTATQAGGQQATYQRGEISVVVSVFHFNTPEQAVENVRFVLASAAITQLVEGPYYNPSAAYGIAQDRHGSYLAAWSHGEWCFVARTTGGLDALDDFLEAFPY